ncbi:MAG TPA: NAD(P)H-dependent glycerol-3-phosphate dehydrogenase [Thermoanaerobaculia bacterium]|nr:NAD(P)H-dependent glycerol-3-phosphate dehydrogenase [Thermoanaerobaculia bacterium]
MSLGAPAPLGILGAGTWGTALAVHLARSGHRVVLRGRSERLMAAIAAERRNATYLPAIVIPDEVEATSDIGRVAACGTVVVVVPSHGFRGAVRELLAARPQGAGALVLVSGTKGIEGGTLARMSEVTFEEAVRARHRVSFAVVSGPSFAEELAAGSPTAAVVASEDGRVAIALQEAMSRRNLRLYSTADVVGVELGGTVKNVIGIAAGVVSGLGLGHNTLAALITRGLSEMSRLGVACGGRASTFSGLAGLGDLVLTSTGGLSRNRRTGEELARGRRLEDIVGGQPTVAEGVRNSRAVLALARRRGVEMPITAQMELVLYHGKEPRLAVEELMSRELKAEEE